MLNGKAIELHEVGGASEKQSGSSNGRGGSKELLWENGVMGFDNAESLNHSLWYTLSQHFGTRGVQEYLQMNLKDFKVVKSQGLLI